MAGRRIREAIKNEFEAHMTTEMNVVLSGLCNIYTHYITTYEEYQVCKLTALSQRLFLMSNPFLTSVQRYEAASTIFGPHTLSAYIQLFRGLAKAIAEVIKRYFCCTENLLQRVFQLRAANFTLEYHLFQGTVRDLPNIPEPPIFNVTSLNFLPIVVDAKPLGRNYGDVLQDVQPKYRMGEVVDVRFVGANPRNSAENMTTFTFLTVEKYDNTSESWKVMYDDASWDTRFVWQKGNWGRSTAVVEWHISNNTEPGTYRIQYFGHSKELLSSIRAFSGSSSQFEVSD
ncbi:hypothetical protein JD844_006519 [Phrynosoma platyrhinos]|uniref:Neutral ceramidase n=1 Tax=Phrynosoma platyrhinos TaxID=52577 RepID=A0ABQ7T284_PHRPL|nr:hypothetical protein JD844_006519 [Phrynosoma platyrhinos]